MTFNLLGFTAVTFLTFDYQQKVARLKSWSGFLCQMIPIIAYVNILLRVNISIPKCLQRLRLEKAFSHPSAKW